MWLTYAINFNSYGFSYPRPGVSRFDCRSQCCLQREFKVLPGEFGPQLHERNGEVSQVGREAQEHHLAHEPHEQQENSDAAPHRRRLERPAQAQEDAPAFHRQQSAPLSPNWGRWVQWRFYGTEQVHHASEYEVPSSTHLQDQSKSGAGFCLGGQVGAWRGQRNSLRS